MQGEPSDSRTSMLRCEGWWEQVDFGRQPMLDLRIQVAEGRIVGSGSDMVGPFTCSLIETRLGYLYPEWLWGALNRCRPAVDLRTLSSGDCNLRWLADLLVDLTTPSGQSQIVAWVGATVQVVHLPFPAWVNFT